MMTPTDWLNETDVDHKLKLVIERIQQDAREGSSMGEVDRLCQMVAEYKKVLGQIKKVAFDATHWKAPEQARDELDRVHHITVAALEEIDWRTWKMKSAEQWIHLIRTYDEDERETTEISVADAEPMRKFIEKIQRDAYNTGSREMRDYCAKVTTDHATYMAIKAIQIEKDLKPGLFFKGDGK